MELIKPSQKALITGLEVKKVTIFMKYFDFANVFFFDSTIELLEHFGINNYFIKHKKGKQSS